MPTHLGPVAGGVQPALEDAMGKRTCIAAPAAPILRALHSQGRGQSQGQGREACCGDATARPIQLVKAGGGRQPEGKASPHVGDFIDR